METEPTNDNTNTEELFAKPSLPGFKYGLRQIKKTEEEEQFEKLKRY
jgi:hypothetical protein